MFIQCFDHIYFTAEQCKKKWINLRDAFRRKVKQNKKCGQVNNKKWIFEDEMSFLIPFLKDRSTNNVQSVEWYLNDDSAVGSPTSQDTNTEDFSESPPDKIQIKSLETQTTENTISAPQTHDQSTKKGIKRKNEENNTSASAVLKYLIDQFQSESWKGIQEGNEANKYFFQSIAKTVNTFSPINQNIIKSQIFSIVSQMELSELQEKQIQQSQEAIHHFSPKSSNSSSFE